MLMLWWLHIQSFVDAVVAVYTACMLMLWWLYIQSFVDTVDVTVHTGPTHRLSINYAFVASLYKKYIQMLKITSDGSSLTF
jgi:hypothetical protein